MEVRAEEEAVQEEVASLPGSAEGSAFGSSFRGQPSQHDADSVASLLGPALGEGYPFGSNTALPPDCLACPHHAP